MLKKRNNLVEVLNKLKVQKRLFILKGSKLKEEEEKFIKNIMKS